MDKELVKEAVREVLFEAGLSKEYSEQRISMNDAIKVIGSRRLVEKAIRNGILTYIKSSPAKNGKKYILLKDVYEYKKTIESKIKIKTNGIL